MKKITLLLVPLFFISCKDNNTTQTEPTQPGNLLVLNDINKSNAENELQAVYTSPKKGINGYVYGDFDSDGKPINITQMNIYKNFGDTAISVLFDNSLRVKTAFISIYGNKLNSILAFDYSISGKVIVNVYYYDFKKDSSRLKHQIVLNAFGNGTYSLDNHTPYKTVQESSSDQINNFITRRNSDFLTQFNSAVNGISTTKSIMKTASTAIGCNLGGFPGCAFVGIIESFTLISPQKALVSETDKLPNNAPQCPTLSFLGNEQISLLFDDISFTSINKCNSNTGSLVRVGFYVFEKEKILDQGDWVIFEKVGGQGWVSFRPTKLGNTIVFNGCLGFGPNSVIPAMYYIKTSSGLTSNIVKVNYFKPPGAK